MTERLQIYKCEICGNIVEMLHPGNGQMVCCDKNMVLYKENTVDASVEKHIPVINKTREGFEVKIGSVSHPMDESHYIEWIEVVVGDKAYRQFLKPGQSPEAVFCIEGNGVVAREFCSLHGLWKS